MRALVLLAAIITTAIGVGVIAQTVFAPASITNAAGTSGSVQGGTTVTITGEHLKKVDRVEVGGEAAHITTHTDQRLVLTTPTQPRFQPVAARVTLLDQSGAEQAHTTFHYRLIDGVDRQLHYVLTYWQHYNTAYQALGDDDCMDFTSQSLLQRGWKQQGTWTHDSSDVYSSGVAWRGSTAFRNFMLEHPSLGTELTNAQRSKVKLGDIVQFDWDNSGDRDHTGVVTRITHTDSGIKIAFAGHTDDTDFRDVDAAIANNDGGKGKVYFWSLK